LLFFFSVSKIVVLAFIVTFDALDFLFSYTGFWSSRHAKEGGRNASSCKGKEGKGNANDGDLVISCQ